MKKPKIKKYKNYWLISKQKSAFKCFNLATVEFYYNFLLATT